MKSKIVLIVVIAAIAFLVNLIWENLQAPLFEGYVSFRQHFKQCLIASVGDMTFIVVIYFIFVTVLRNWYWIQNLTWNSAVSVALSGGISAIVFEKLAFSLGYWNYGKMPVIPTLDVGLLPVIQLMILPLVTYFLANLLLKSLTLR